MNRPRLPSQHAAPLWLRAALRTLSVISPERAGHLGAELFSTPRARRIRDSEDEWLARARTTRVTSREVELVAHVWGSGPLVLLHHGWSGNAAQMTALVPALLDRGFAVAALDAAGHGASGGRRNNLVWMTADAIAAARALQAEAFVGHSMGAVAGVRAHRTGSEFQRMVLLAPPAEFEPYFIAFAHMVGLSDRAFAHMIEVFGTRLGTRFEELTAEWLTNAPLPPALVVHDADDEDVPPAHARRWLDRWPATVAELRTEGLGHRAILRDASVIERVAQFLSGD